MLWYAVQKTREDAWDYGSHDLEEAKQMLKERGYGLIAVIDEDSSFCEKEIEFDEIGRYWLDSDYTHENGDLSRPKYALKKVTLDEDGDEEEETILWGFWEDVPGYGDENANPDDVDKSLDEIIEKELGFLPQYEIN